MPGLLVFGVMVYGSDGLGEVGGIGGREPELLIGIPAKVLSLVHDDPKALDMIHHALRLYVLTNAMGGPY